MCVFSSHSFWTSSSLDVPAGVTQEEGHTGFLIRLLSAVRALIFLARRIQPFLSLVDREVKFCVLTIESFSTRWAFLFLFFSFLVRKVPFAGIELTSQRVRGLRGTSELPGRPALEKKKSSKVGIESPSTPLLGFQSSRGSRKIKKRSLTNLSFFLLYTLISKDEKKHRRRWESNHRQSHS